MNSPNIVSLEPEAIREMFDAESEFADLIENASDKQLEALGAEVLSRDELWQTCHRLLEEAIKYEFIS